ncbi:hypothetical protein R1flu_007181 [Riccia fluitans]|uniref:Uncharacterized protein n=1 Tax=Riccia fluitans TaxID=41844 RepID=A0ABD1YY42_9MARC
MVGKANRNFCLTTLVLLAVAHVDPRMADYRPDWHMWVSFEIQSRLSYGGKDKFSGGKFREGWEAIVRIVTADFVAKQATTRHEPCYWKLAMPLPMPGLSGTMRRENLFAKEKLLKKSLTRPRRWLQKVEQRTEAVRLEKEALQQQYAKDKAEWERKNTQLIGEVGQLHEEKKRNATREG